MDSPSPSAPPPTVELPPISEFSPAVVSFLNASFGTKQTLNPSESTHLVSALQTQCDQLTGLLSDLLSRLQTSILSYDSCSDRAKGAIGRVTAQLSDLRSTTSLTRVPPVGDGDGDGERDGLGTAEQVVAEELPALAKEVARVEAVRIYAETAMKLDSLIGDIEDTVSFLINKSLRKQPTSQSSEESWRRVISSLKLTENILTSVSAAHSQWTRLISAVDDRVDRALAILRPQAIADHRALLSSLGWPPSLSTLSSNRDLKSSAASNPLLVMNGEVKEKYCQNFLALCSLQELQLQRKSRQLEGRNRDIALHQPLWAIEELVNPISVACQQHFLKWADKPEFIFALVYKITKDYADSIDELLQPLIDEARLAGYSSREEWIAAMVNALSMYLAKEIFPTYVSHISMENAGDVQSQARILWLNLVDLMVEFDKKVRSLFDQSGILGSLQEDGNLERISSLSVFSDRHDWLGLWTDIELEDVFEKLKIDIEDERIWANQPQGVGTHLPGSDHYKAPLISSVILRRLSSVIDRTRTLPNMAMRLRFLRSVALPIVHKFQDCWLTKCLEAEGLTALATDDALIKVIASLNSTCHFESVLKEWSGDLFFLEMGLEQDVHPGFLFSDENNHSEGWEEEPVNGIFGAEVKKLEEFRKEWTDKIITAVLRGFEALFRDYVKNRKQWQEKLEEGETVTSSFVVALDYLQGKLSVLEMELNTIDFTTAWRILASSVDRLIFTSIFMSNIKFSQDGVERLGNDMIILFGLFRPWCLRPEGFFPRVTEGLKMLKMGEDEIQILFVQGKEWMKNYGIRHLSLAEAERISRSRAFAN